ncbi:hypothetical protein EMCRGX_G003797 [Ephydatia muelleri]
MWKEQEQKPLEKLCSAVKGRIEIPRHGGEWKAKTRARERDLANLCKGIANFPALLQPCPDTALECLNLGDYEVSGVEPLHDFKGHMSNLLEELPFHVVEKAYEELAVIKKSVLGKSTLSEISTHELLHEQLFSPQLFRLWRTGVNELAFNPAEDDGDFDTTGLNYEAGEYALNKDLIVEHWLTHRAYNKEALLRDFYGGQFVIMNEKLSEEFDHFRKHGINGSFYPVESLQLLECWFKSSGISIKTIIRYGKRYFLLSAANIDAFCHLNLASKPDLNVCASGFIQLQPDNCTTNEAKVSVNDCDEEKQQRKKTSDEEKPIKKARKMQKLANSLDLQESPDQQKLTNNSSVANSLGHQQDHDLMANLVRHEIEGAVAQLVVVNDLDCLDHLGDLNHFCDLCLGDLPRRPRSLL